MTAPTHPMRGSSQPDRIRSMNLKDQFGRLWLVDIDIKTGGRTGLPHPAGWEDPIQTPPLYIQLARDGQSVVVLYEKWARDLTQAHAEWQQKYQELGYARYGDQFDETKPPSPMMARAIGPRPLDPEIPQQAALGNIKMLGVAPEITKAQKLATLEQEMAALREKNAQLMEAMIQRNEDET
jgi:hypothetical protein